MVLELARADAAGKGTDPTEQWEILGRLRERVERLREQGMAWTVRDLDVDGRELMESLGLQPGPLVGQILARLLDQVVETPEVNRKDELLSRARTLLQELNPT